MNHDQAANSPDAFTMPEVKVGTCVVWYRFGTRDPRRAETAFIVRFYGRNVSLALASGQRIDSVRHVDDPKLMLSQDQREQGAWDFTDEFKQNHATHVDLERRLQALEDRLTTVIIEKASNATQSLPQRKVLAKPLRPGETSNMVNADVDS